MKTITIKLPEEEAKKLDLFVAKKHYPSKSEYIRHLIMREMGELEKENAGWLALAEKAMEKMWNNKKDDEIWSQYL
ncbi:MAG: ribbon-helix-helix protein, CopG family [Candidatus Diapherotrites archaeon]|nr:ribbon-helix-helix protein, CopG family [Candidatus Diapherotrites archaeon]